MLTMTDDTPTLDGELTSAVDMPTQSADADKLAWSHADDETDLLQRAPWRSAWGRAALFIFAGLVLAAIVAAIGVTMSGRNTGPVSQPTSSPAMPASQLPPISSAPIETPAPPRPVPDADPITLTPADQGYLNMLRDGGILIGNVPQIINLGHLICTGRAQGLSETQIANAIAAHNPQIGAKGARVEIESAEPAYCPQYNAGTWAN